MALKVYKSSAGSGKTFTLVKSYLKLCLSEESPFYFASILAITFTNKATSEMKERIIAMLKKLAAGDEDEVMVKILMEECQLSLPEIQSRAQRILARLLHQYGDFSVSTIDHFIHKVTRTFARDLGISMSFQVLLSEDELLQKSISSLVNDYGKDEEITELLDSFLHYNLDNEKSWRIEDQLFNFSKTITSENSFVYLNALKNISRKTLKEVKQDLYRKKNTLEAKLIQEAESAYSLISTGGIEKEYFSRQTVPKYLKRIIDGDFGKMEKNSAIEKGMEEGKWYTAKTPKEMKALIEGISDQLSQHLSEILDLVPVYVSYLAVLENFHALQLVSLVEERFSKLKKIENSLHISDLNKKIAEVVLKEPIPFIYERIGERYDNIMIDEFQDTSILQFINLLPLIEESLSGGKFNMLVGDAKQAIYRFRGGESRQFAQMPHIEDLYHDQHQLVHERLDTLKATYDEELLGVNRRSHRAIIEFNNDFFTFISETQSHSINQASREIYAEVRQEIPEQEKDSEGYVELNLLEESGSEAHLEACLEKVERALEGKYKLSDIAVLCRKKAECKEVAEYLKKHGKEVFSSEALWLSSSLKVNFLIAFLKWFVMPEDVVSRVTIIEFLSRDKNDLERVRNLKEFAPASASLLAFFKQEGYEFDFAKMRSLDLFAFFESSIRTFKLNQPFDQYVQFLQEYAFEYVRSKDNDFEGFIEWWDSEGKSKSIDASAEVDAIKILTYHKSKGLEFPITIIPFIGSGKPPRDSSIWAEVPESLNLKLPFAQISVVKKFDLSLFYPQFEEEREKKQQDMLNENYVAYTRAGERLYLIIEPTPKSSSVIRMHNLLADYMKQKGEDSVLKLGVESPKQHKEKDNKLDYQEREMSYISSDWRQRIRLSSDLTSFYDEAEKSKAIERGTTIHEILAAVDDLSDLDSTVQRFYLKGRIDKAEGEQYKEKLHRILSLKEVAPYFQLELKSRKEALMLSDQGKRLRADRIIQHEDGSFFIIDYKTGEEREEHQNQLAEYIEVLKKASNKPVSGALLYIDEEKFVPFS